MQNNESVKSNKNISARRFFRKRKLKLIFNFISAVFIPVLVAVITIIITLQQESIAKANRDADLHIAEEQHKQNFELAIDEQRNAHLTAYMHEISNLLLANNFSLNKKMVGYIIRPKTFAILRQLDVTRKGYLLRFLEESELLSMSNTSFLDLNGADFDDIQIGLPGDNIDMRHSSFSAASFKNASFAFTSLGYSDFSFCNLRGASFLFDNLDYIKFNNAKLQDADFGESNIYKADLSRANMTNTKISQKQVLLL